MAKRNTVPFSDIESTVERTKRTVSAGILAHSQEWSPSQEPAGNLLRNARESSEAVQGLTLTEVADRLGIQKSRLSKLETGELNSINSTLLENMISLYECPRGFADLLRRVFATDDMEGHRMTTTELKIQLRIQMESAFDLVESGDYPVVCFFDQSLDDMIDEVYLKWTVYHISERALLASILEQRNHWIGSTYRREWFIQQATLPKEERRIFVTPTFDKERFPFPKFNVCMLDKLFAISPAARSARGPLGSSFFTISPTMIAQLDEWDKYLRQTAIDYPPEYFEKCYREYSRVKHDLEEIRNSIEE